MLTAHSIQYLNSYNESISPITSLDSLYIEHASKTVSSQIKYTISRISLIDASMPIALIHDSSSDILKCKLYNISDPEVQSKVQSIEGRPELDSTGDIKVLEITSSYNTIIKDKSTRNEVEIDKEYDVSIATYNLSNILENYITYKEVSDKIDVCEKYIINISDTILNTAISNSIKDISNNISSNINNDIIRFNKIQNHISTQSRYTRTTISEIADIYSGISTESFIPGTRYYFSIDSNNYAGNFAQTFSRMLFTYAITPNLLSETCYEMYTGRSGNYVGNILKLDFQQIQNGKVKCYYMKDIYRNIETPFDHELIITDNMGNAHRSISNNINTKNIVIKPGCSSVSIISGSNITIGYDNDYVDVSTSTGITNTYVNVGNNNSHIYINGNNITLHNNNYSLKIHQTDDATTEPKNITIYSNNHITSTNNYSEVYGNNLTIYNNVIPEACQITYLMNSILYTANPNTIDYIKGNSYYNNMNFGSIIFDGTVYASGYYGENNNY